MVCRSLCPQHPSQGHAHSRCHTLPLRTTGVAGSGNWAPERERGRIQSPDNTSSFLAQTAKWVGLYLRESRGHEPQTGEGDTPGPLQGVLLDALSFESLREAAPGILTDFTFKLREGCDLSKTTRTFYRGFRTHVGVVPKPTQHYPDPRTRQGPDSAPRWQGTVQPSLAPGLSPSSTIASWNQVGRQGWKVRRVRVGGRGT